MAASCSAAVLARFSMAFDSYYVHYLVNANNENQMYWWLIAMLCSDASGLAARALLSRWTYFKLAHSAALLQTYVKR